MRLERRLEEVEIRGRVETFQTTALRFGRILGRALETRGDSGIPPANAGVKNSQGE